MHATIEMHWLLVDPLPITICVNQPCRAQYLIPRLSLSFSFLRMCENEPGEEARSTYVVPSFCLDHRPCIFPTRPPVFVSFLSSPAVSVAAVLSPCSLPCPHWLRPPALQDEPSWTHTQQAYPLVHSAFSFSKHEIRKSGNLFRT